MSQRQEEIQKALGARIRDLRSRNARLSQEALADACGMHRAHIGQIERGEVDVSLSTVARIAKALNTTVSRLFQEIDV
jgi:transcriptional regulator with XRE-family HTH domain